MPRLANALRMVRWPVLVSLMFLVPILTACQVNQTASISPDASTGLVAQPAEVNLGRVPFDQPAHARFTLVNRGSDEVHLDTNVEVQTLEGC